MSRSRLGWGLREGDVLVPGRTVLAELGGGKRFEVLLVADDELGGPAVAKILRPDRLDDRSLRALQREAELLARLSHPSVVKALDAVLDGPRPHLLLEHIEGPSLRALSREDGPMDPGRVAAIARPLAEALAHVEDRGVAHLDVKPSNVVVADPPRLLDLSVARSLDRVERVRGVVGTDAYLAPEQTGVKGWRGRVSSPADVWGLGATLHRCLAGRRPFPRSRAARDSEDANVRFPQLTTAPGALPAGVPAELADLIARMLRREPAERPGAAQVVAELEALAAAPKAPV